MRHVRTSTESWVSDGGRTRRPPVRETEKRRRTLLHRKLEIFLAPTAATPADRTRRKPKICWTNERERLRPMRQQHQSDSQSVSRSLGRRGPKPQCASLSPFGVKWGRLLDSSCSPDSPVSTWPDDFAPRRVAGGGASNE